MIEEKWRPYAAVNGYVEVSNLGRVRNAKTKRVLVLTLNKSTKYLGVSIKHQGKYNKGKCVRVARAVAETWIENPDNLPVVNHKDSDRTNNHIENLEWCTQRDNYRHARAKGRTVIPVNFGVLSEEQVRHIRESFIKRSRDYGARALAKKFNVSHSTIRRSLCYDYQIRSLAQSG